MATSDSDFDAAKAVADQLKGLDKERQQRVLRWVAESLNLDLGTALGTPPRSSELQQDSTGGHYQLPEHARRHRPTDIKSFVDAKQPKSDVQFAAVVAYYYRFEAPAETRKDAIDAQTLQDGARLAGRRRPPKPLMTLNNAKNLGYLDSSERGQFRINNVGENLVAMTLPGSGVENARGRSRSTKKRGAAKKNKRYERKPPRHSAVAFCFRSPSRASHCLRCLETDSQLFLSPPSMLAATSSASFSTQSSS